MNEYTKRAEELKAILYISKVKVNTEKTAENSSAPSNNGERSPTLGEKIFMMYYIILFVLSLVTCNFYLAIKFVLNIILFYF